MAKKESSLEESKKRAEAALNRTNTKIEELGARSSMLSEALGALQDSFDKIRNVPEKERLEFERVKKIRLDWKQQAEKIEADYAAAQAKDMGKGAAGAGAGIAVVALGPAAAMGVATTFGVASTGTAISALSGAAATNAALAWLGGGALAAGGGGMVAGEALLALAGPVGWAIAGVSLLGSGALLIKNRNDKKRIDEVFSLISKRDAKSYELAIVELEERIKRIDEETLKAGVATGRISTFGTDYGVMTEDQQYELGSYVNLMNASIQLLVNPILGLLPKYTDVDFEEFVDWRYANKPEKTSLLIVHLCNLLYRIDLDDKDWKLLYKVFRGNKELLSQLDLEKSDFEESVMETVKQALLRKYQILEQAS